MDRLFELLLGLTQAQIIGMVLLLIPTASASWAILRWIFDVRIKHLESALVEFRSNFDRKLAWEVNETTQRLLEENRRLLEENALLTERVETYKAWALYADSEITNRKLLALLSSQPSLIGEIMFTKAQYEAIFRSANSRDSNAQFILGIMLFSGRFLKDGTLIAMDRTEGISLITEAATAGHYAAQTYLKDRA